MNKLQKYIDRVTKEWLEHGKLIIAVDFDDTIIPWGLNTSEECNYVVEKLKTYQELGAHIIIFTCSNKDRYPDISKFCDDNGLIISSINSNAIEGLPWGHTGKVYANAFIDDRAGLHETLYILDCAMANIKSKKQSVNNSEFNQF